MKQQPNDRPISDELYERLRQHPHYHTTQQLIQQIHEDLTSSITAVRPADPNKTISYQQLLKQFEDRRGTPLFYPYMGTGLGNGPYVLLEDGSVKIDCITGIGPNYWGHSCREYLPHAVDALLFSNTIMQGNLQPNRIAKNLMELLTSVSGFDHCFLTTSGTMSGENALKILFQKAYPRNRILAFERCFAGRSLAMAQITDKATYRKGLPSTIQVDYLPFYDEELGVDGSFQRTWAKVEEHFARNPQRHAALCAELIQGEGGFRVGHPLYFQKLFSALKEQNVLLWVDEVQTFGRTQELFAAETFHVIEMVDVLNIGKVSQACATLFRKELRPIPGLINQTFMASSSALFYAHWSLQKALEDGHYGPNGKICQLWDAFSLRLQELSERSKGLICPPQGMGAMISFTPFRGEEKTTIEYAKRLFDNGLIAFTCGVAPTKIRLLPPAGIMNSSHIDEAVSIIEKTLWEVHAKL